MESSASIATLSFWFDAESFIKKEAQSSKATSPVVSSVAS